MLVVRISFHVSNTSFPWLMKQLRCYQWLVRWSRQTSACIRAKHVGKEECACGHFSSMAQIRKSLWSRFYPVEVLILSQISNPWHSHENRPPDEAAPHLPGAPGTVCPCSGSPPVLGPAVPVIRICIHSLGPSCWREPRNVGAAPGHSGWPEEGLCRERAFLVSSSCLALLSCLQPPLFL